MSQYSCTAGFHSWTRRWVAVICYLLVTQQAAVSSDETPTAAPQQPAATRIPLPPDNMGEFADIKVAWREDGESAPNVAIVPGDRQLVVSVRAIRNGGVDLEQCSLRLLDMQTGLEVRRFENSNLEIQHVAVSADGKHVIAIVTLDQNSNHVLHVWELATGKKLRTSALTGRLLGSVSMSPDGRAILQLDQEDRIGCRLVDLASGTELAVLKSPDGLPFACASMLHDGNRALTASTDHRNGRVVFRLWSIKQGKVLLELEPRPLDNYTLIVAPDDRTVVVSAQARLSWYDLESGKLLRQFKPSVIEDTRVIFSPSGDKILFAQPGANQRPALIYDLKRERVDVETWCFHVGMNAPALSADGKTMVAACGDGAISLWRVSFADQEETVIVPPFNPVDVFDHTPFIRDRLSWQDQYGLKPVTPDVAPEAIHPIPPVAAVVKPQPPMPMPAPTPKEAPPPTYKLPSAPDNAGEILRFAVITENEGLQLGPLAVSPNKKWLAINVEGDTDGRKDPAKCSLRLLDSKTGKEVRRFEDSQLQMSFVDITGDGKYVLGCSNFPDGLLHIWNLKTGKKLRTARLTGNGKSFVSPSADGSVILQVETVEAPTMRLVKTDTGEELASVETPDGYGFSSVCLLSDCRRAITASADTLHNRMLYRIWDLYSGDVIRELEPRAGASHMSQILVSADDSMAIIGRSPNSFYWYDLASGKLLKQIHSRHYLSNTALSPQGDKVWMGWLGNDDYPSLVYDLKHDRTTLECWLQTEAFRHWNVSTDRKFVFFAANDGTVQAWKITFRDQDQPAMAFSRTWREKPDPLDPMPLRESKLSEYKVSLETAAASPVVNDPPPPVNRVFSAESEARRKPIREGRMIGSLSLIEPQDSRGRPILRMGRPVELAAGDNQRLGAGFPVLLRELVRQAVLLAARDHLGLTTRDAILEESTLTPEVDDGDLKEASNAKLLVWLYVTPEQIWLRLSPGGPKSKWERIVWEAKLDGPHLPVDNVSFQDPAASAQYNADLALSRYRLLLESAEIWSRDGLPAALRMAGFPQAKSGELTTGKLSPNVRQEMSRLSMLAQFSAIRDLHQQHRVEGESTAVTAALAHAYAHLGFFTEHQWSAAPKACKARSLLYAQRLLAKSPKSAWSHAHRAYVLALTGFHAAALEDLEECRRLYSLGKKDVADKALPLWIQVIESHCRFDEAFLLHVPAKAPEHDLAALLRVAQLYNSQSPDPSAALCSPLLQQYPECLKLIDAAYRLHSPELEAAMTERGSKALERLLQTELHKLDGLPSGVRQVLDNAGRQGRFVGLLVEALQEAGSSRVDDDEFSWLALARAVHDEQFVCCARRVDFLLRAQGVSAEPYIQQAQEELGDHRYRELFANLPAPGRDLNRKLSPDVRQIAQEPGDLGPAQVADWLRLRGYKQSTWSGSGLVQGFNSGSDVVYQDIVEFLHEQHHLPVKAHALARVSPYAPDGFLALVEQGRLDIVGPRIAEWEQAHRDDPGVMRSLARAYERQENWDEAERYYRATIALSPSYDSYKRLAELFQKRGQHDKRRATLEEFVKLESKGLERTYAWSDIANAWMDEGDYAAALPFVKKATPSGAEIGMIAAARCHTGLREYQTALEWHYRIQSRYRQHEVEVVKWCRLYGQKPDQEICEQAQAEIEKQLHDLKPGEWYHAASLLAVAGSRERALEVFEAAVDKDENQASACFNWTHAALLADELGQTERRDRLLRRAAEQHDLTAAPVSRMAMIMQNIVQNSTSSNETNSLDLTAFESLLKDTDERTQADLLYSMGRCLQLHQRLELANKYYQRAANMKNSTATVSHDMACGALRAQGIEPGED